MKADVVGNMSKQSLAFQAVAQELLTARKANRGLAEDNAALRNKGTPVANPTAYIEAAEQLTTLDLINLLNTRLRYSFSADTEEGCLCIAIANRLILAEAKKRRR